MKINNEFLINNFFEMNNKVSKSENEEKGSSFSEILMETVNVPKDIIKNEISNGDSFLKEISNNNIFEGGGWAYVDKYGYSHVVGDYKTAAQFRKQGTEVYQYNGRYGGGYGLDKENNRLRIPIPEEKPFGNDLLKDQEEKAKFANINNIGIPVDYLKYLKIMTGMKKVI